MSFPRRQESPPFEIPDSWKWVKSGSVYKPTKRGKSPKYIDRSNVLVFAQKCNQKDPRLLSITVVTAKVLRGQSE